MTIKLIALDLDGTVLRRDRTISARVTEATRAAAKQGCYVTIATGRMPISAREVARALNVNTLVICQHGGMLADVDTGELSRRAVVPRDVLCNALGACQTHPQWHPVLFALDSIVLSELKYAPSVYSLGNVDVQLRPDLSVAANDMDFDKLMLMLDPAEADTALRIMADTVGQRAAVVQSSPRLVEVTSLEATKGAALAQLAAQLGVAQDDVLAIGDHDNDESMLAWAGMGVAMGNASLRARAAAKWVAPIIDDDGAAVAIEKFVLLAAE